MAIQISQALFESYLFFGNDADRYTDIKPGTVNLIDKIKCIEDLFRNHEFSEILDNIFKFGQKTIKSLEELHKTDSLVTSRIHHDRIKNYDDSRKSYEGEKIYISPKNDPHQYFVTLGDKYVISIDDNGIKQYKVNRDITVSPGLIKFLETDPKNLKTPKEKTKMDNLLSTLKTTYHFEEVTNTIEIHEYIIKHVCNMSDDDTIKFTKAIIYTYVQYNLNNFIENKCFFDGVVFEAFLDRLRYFTTPEGGKYWDPIIYNPLKELWFNAIKKYYSVNNFNMPNSLQIIVSDQQNNITMNTVMANNVKLNFSNNHYDQILKSQLQVYNIQESTSIEHAIQLIIDYIENSIEIIKNDTNKNINCWMLASKICREPMRIYEIMLRVDDYNNVDQDNRLLWQLFLLFKKWVSIVSNISTFNIYKYAYYLVINKLLSKHLKNIQIRNKNMFDDFVCDCGNSIIYDNSILHDIDVIKNAIVTTKPIWFNTQELFSLHKIIYTELSSDGTKKKKVTSDNISKTFSSVILTNPKICNNFINGFFSVNSQGLYDNSIKVNNHEIFVDENCMVFYFPINDFSKKSNFVSIAIQFVLACKATNRSEICFPYMLPSNKIYMKPNVPTTSENTGEIDLENNEFYYTVNRKDINVYEKEPFEIVSTSANISRMMHNMKPLFGLFRFMETRDGEHLEKILPFIKYGFGTQLSDPKNVIDDILIYSKLSENNLYSTKTLYSHNDFITNFTTKIKTVDDIRKHFNEINSNDNIGKRHYNIFIFLYSLLLNDGFENIMENKLYTPDDIIELNGTLTEKLCAISNGIKFFAKRNMPEYKKYLELLNTFVTNEFSIYNKNASFSNDIINMECSEALCFLLMNIPKFSSTGIIENETRYGDLVNHTTKIDKISTLETTLFIKKIKGLFGEKDLEGLLKISNGDLTDNIKKDDLPFFDNPVAGMVQEVTRLQHGGVGHTHNQNNFSPQKWNNIKKFLIEKGAKLIHFETMAKDYIKAQKNKIEIEKNELTAACRILHGKLTTGKFANVELDPKKLKFNNNILYLDPTYPRSNEHNAKRIINTLMSEYGFLAFHEGSYINTDSHILDGLNYIKMLKYTKDETANEEQKNTIIAKFFDKKIMKDTNIDEEVLDENGNEKLGVGDMLKGKFIELFRLYIRNEIKGDNAKLQELILNFNNPPEEKTEESEQTEELVNDKKLTKKSAKADKRKLEIKQLGDVLFSNPRELLQPISVLPKKFSKYDYSVGIWLNLLDKKRDEEHSKKLAARHAFKTHWKSLKSGPLKEFAPVTQLAIPIKIVENYKFPKARIDELKNDIKKFIELVKSVKGTEQYITELNNVIEFSKPNDIGIEQQNFTNSDIIKFPTFGQEYQDKKQTILQTLTDDILGILFVNHIAMFFDKNKIVTPTIIMQEAKFNEEIGDSVRLWVNNNSQIKQIFISEHTEGDLTKSYIRAKHLHNNLENSDMEELLSQEYGIVMYDKKDDKFYRKDREPFKDSAGKNMYELNIKYYNIIKSATSSQKKTFNINGVEYIINIEFTELFVPKEIIQSGKKLCINKIIINKDEFSNTNLIDEYMKKMVPCHIDNSGNIIINFPLFIKNLRFSEIFEWNKSIGKSKNSKINYQLKITGNQISKLDGDEIYIPLDTLLLNNGYESIIPFIWNLLIIAQPDDIIVWRRGDEISSIDILSINVNFKLIKNNIANNYDVIMNDEYILVNGDNWMIQRWVSNISNLFMVKDKNGNYMIHVFPIKTLKSNIRISCQIFNVNLKHKEHDTNNLLKFKFNRSESESSPLRLDMSRGELIIIKLNPITMMPIINDEESLKRLCLSYACFNEVGNILELGNLIRKFKIDFIEYKNIFIRELIFHTNKIMNKFAVSIPLFASRYRVPSFARVKAQMIGTQFRYKPIDKTSLPSNYEHEFILDKTINDVDTFMMGYYFQQNPTYIIPSLPEYYTYSLLNNKNMNPNITYANYAFSLFFNRLKILYGSYGEDLQEEFNNIYNQIQKYKVNPIEFFYQCVIGYIARDQQKEMVNMIYEDICDKVLVPQQGGYKSLTQFMDAKFKFTEKLTKYSRIHNLIMGGGKTTMITPLVILRFLQQKAFEVLNANDHVYLVLPENLVAQSYAMLSSSLNLYFPINIVKIFESRNITDDITYTKSLDNKSDLELYLYIMSDVTMKCGMINDYTKVVDNSNKHCYLFDEIDTILDPIVSELNYPDTNTKTNLQNLDQFFNVVYNALYDIFKSPTTEIDEILNRHEFDYSLSPHFNIINSTSKLTEELINYIKAKLIKHFEENNKIEILEGLKGKLMENTTNQDISVIISVNNLLNEAMPVALTFINRKNYGLNKSNNFPIVVPFAYAETPRSNSNFSNPLITLVLTMIEYIVQLLPLKNITIQNLIDLIRQNYNEIPAECRQYSEISEEYNKLNITIELDQINNIEKLTNTDIEKLRTNKLFSGMICLKNCSKFIEFETKHDNISGIDLLMSFNASHRSGFTGTPNVPKFIDFYSDKTISVTTASKDTMDKINIAFAKSEIKIYNDTNTPLEYLNSIMDNLNDESCNVIIDAGSILVGITPIQVHKLVITKRSNYQFIYWNDEDVPIVRSTDGKEIRWDKIAGSKMFYYYDHRHTTGIDAQIPNNTIGLVLLGKNSRYRDVVQSMFRMRKSGTEHKIRFILNNKIKMFVEAQYEKNLTREVLQEWINNEESTYANLQQKSMNVQNLFAIGRCKLIDKRKDNFFRYNNVFVYPTLKSLKEKDTNSIAKILANIQTEKTNDILKTKNIISDRMHEIGLVPNINNEKINLLINLLTQKELMHTSDTSITMSIQQEHEQRISQKQNQTQVINENIIQKIEYIANLVSNKTIFDYFDVDNVGYYEKNVGVKDLVYISKNIKYYKQPYIILASNKKFFLVPFLEGYKLFDTINSLNIPISNMTISDSTGLIYKNNTNDIEKEYNSSIGIFISKKYNDNIYVSLENYITMFKIIKNNYLAEFNMPFINFIGTVSNKSEMYKAFENSIGMYIKNKEKYDQLLVAYFNSPNKKTFYEITNNEDRKIFFFTCNGKIFNNITF